MLLLGYFCWFFLSSSSSLIIMNEARRLARMPLLFTSREKRSRLLETTNGRKASTVNGGYIRRRRFRAADGATRALNFPAVGAKRGVGEAGAVAAAKRHGSNEQCILKQGFFNSTPLDVVGRNRPGQGVASDAESRQFCQRSPFGRQCPR
jgi:hypothetical protein